MAENRYGKKWSEEETILAFNLYCQVPFSKIGKGHPDIVALANLLGRTPSSVGLKMANLAHFDPELRKRSVSGMAHASKSDEEIVLRFVNNWEELAFKAKLIEADLRGATLEEIISMDFTDLPEGTNRDYVVKTRVNQQFFRDSVLSSYQHKCCMTGLDIPELLIASHIKPWNISDPKTERTNPSNGLCLNALHDRAFDRGLITVMPDMTIRASSKLKGKFDEGTVWLMQSDRQAIRKPDRFLPQKDFLQYHNDMIFKS